MDERHATVYRRDREVIVTSSSKTTAGYWLDNGAYERLSVDINDRMLGESIERMLAKTQQNVPVPNWHADPKWNPLASLYESLSVRSWRGFAGRALLVSVTVTGSDRVEVTPLIRERRPRSAFVELSDEAERLDAPGTVALGAAVRRALATAEAAPLTRRPDLS